MKFADHDDNLLPAGGCSPIPTLPRTSDITPRIEGLLGLLAHRYGARKSRYIGSAKARLQAAWAAALVKLNAIAPELLNQAA